MIAELQFLTDRRSCVRDLGAVLCSSCGYTNNAYDYNQVRIIINPLVNDFSSATVLATVCVLCAVLNNLCRLLF